MNYRIELAKPAAKALKKISKAAQKRIADKIDSLSENLPNPDTTKMKGDNPFYKVRVSVVPEKKADFYITRIFIKPK